MKGSEVAEDVEGLKCWWREREMTAEFQDRNMSWSCLKGTGVQKIAGRDWKELQLKQREEVNQMVTHNTVFVKNPVFESKQFHFPIKSL